jgi:hypothetical protein
MKRIMGYVFTSLLIIAVAIGLYLSRNWNSTTALFPRAVCIPILAVLVAILAVDIKQGQRQKINGETDGDGDREFSAITSRTVKYFGWLVGFGVLIWAIGIVYSIPIYVFSYLKTLGKQSWLKSGLYAAGAVAVIYILFEFAFHVAWPEGTLLSILHL